MIRKIFCRAAVLSLACLTLTALSGCGAQHVNKPKETNAASKTKEEKEATLPVSVPDTADEHPKLPLWEENNTPFRMENGGREATIQPFLTEGADAAVIIFPGGGYFQLSEESEGVAVAKAYNEQGYSAFVVCYRYEPYDGRATLADGQRAIQYVRYHAQEYGISPEKIAVCGFSAGGHLAVMTAEHAPEENFAGDASEENFARDAIGECSSYPNACILGYPVTTLGDGTFITMPRIFLGEKQTEEAEIAKYSYPTNLDLMPPTFVFYSEQDTAVDYLKNSVAFAKALRDAGKTVVCRGYKDGGHGVGLGTAFPDFSAWLEESARFLKDIGF